MNRPSYLAIFILFIFSITPSLVSASSITGGNDVIERSGRDGAHQITFIDLDHRISGDGWLTGWSFFADYDVPGATSDPRQVKLKIFRENGANYDLVGQSDMVTVSAWDKVYSFSLPNIPVKQNDIIGWYYPEQDWPGGVISYQSSTGTNTVWTVWPDPEGEITGSVSKSRFSAGGEGRLYSIRVEGTDVNPVPLPPAMYLLGSGLMGLAWVRNRFHK
ncbi:MAG: hypothetical protein A4E72_02172 [Syntrophus sp. PtaU1.Bin208]|nr:MAG: hypothetical protein A4E72_02172 [Syntrophus sp. PtaU1.Bin208]